MMTEKNVSVKKPVTLPKAVVKKADEVSAKTAEIEKTIQKDVVKPTVKAVKKAVKPVEKKAKQVKKTVEKEVLKKEIKREEKKSAVKEKISIQFDGLDYSTADLIRIAKDVWVYDLLKKESELKNVELYVKPEEHKVYYVMNGEEGDFTI